MQTNFKILSAAIAAALLLCTVVSANEEEMHVEHTTVSPLADMSLLEPIKPKDPVASMMMTDKHKQNNSEKSKMDAIKTAPDSQTQTIADFVIHPLIALKPRLPSDSEALGQGKQAAETDSSTTAPWQLFGFNAGQGLVPSVSTLAGSVTGWLGNRIQIPGLLESSTSTTTTTTTTTPRPEVVVQLQHNSNKRQPFISLNNDNNTENRRRKKKRGHNKIQDSEEDEDDDEYDNEDEEDEDDEDFEEFEDLQQSNKNRKFSNDNQEEDSNEDVDFEDEETDHDDEDDEEEELPPKKTRPQSNRRRHSKPLNTGNPRRGLTNQKPRAQQNHHREQESEEQTDDYVEDEEYSDDENSNSNEVNADEEEVHYKPSNSNKRSQEQQNFFQRGQQTILNQIRQLTRGQSPGEVGSALRVRQKPSQRPQKATLLINRNGQAVYVAPELLQGNGNSIDRGQYQFFQPSAASVTSKRPTSPNYPQPPLTIPLKRKGKPTQYITIPWAQLGITPPNNAQDISEGIQSQPLILNIPQSAINAMQNPQKSQRKPIITPDAVPLLADASIMDIFKPPQIPPARSPTQRATKKPAQKLSNNGSPIVIATRPKILPQRIRPGTIVEKAPAQAEDNMANNSESSFSLLPSANSQQEEANQFILVGEDSEPGLGRKASHASYLPFLQRGNQFIAYRTGRDLAIDDKQNADVKDDKKTSSDN